MVFGSEEAARTGVEVAVGGTSCVGVGTTTSGAARRPEASMV